jgi:hypothetical protein
LIVSGGFVERRNSDFKITKRVLKRPAQVMIQAMPGYGSEPEDF